ncbi:DUF6919 domain-containing protein [Streptomyces javensis]|uniref:DUF6919 domain-containing protein n=1 Tax=Streptomyces javensis TaxID=114698 RepID=A0ABS0R5N8_9ACTN|nr:hypothetical protein [Streptomyces javensis]MBI0312716.1 hypothetical protein [Streptomyces javensis]
MTYLKTALEEAQHMHLTWMSRRDRSRWKDAQTIGQLGGLMALWLEGIIESRPGYAPRRGPDDETGGLVPSLAALCRAGFVTTDSQPGLTGQDEAWWEQRAAVHGVLTDRALFYRLVETSVEAGMRVRVNDYRRSPGIQDPPITVTTREDKTAIPFGGPTSRRRRARQWNGLNRQLHHQIVHGTYLTIAAPEYGPSGERLWAVLDIVSGLRTASNDPWA